MDGKDIERKAHALLEEHSYEDASELFYKAAMAYKDEDRHQEAALCFASSAGSWTLKFGEKTSFHAGEIYKQAAQEAEKAGDMEYTGLLYKHAAICYERDMEFMGFSECYFRSKECYRKFLAHCLFNPGKFQTHWRNTEKSNSREKFKKAIEWIAISFSSILWGHGERPQRTVLFGGLIIFLSAILYMQGSLLKDDQLIRPDIFNAIYFSVVTFTTVGYGDLVPVGTNKLVMMIESFGGLFIIPLFITSLCRKYLRF